jgi:hypothetical protein
MFRFSKVVAIASPVAHSEEGWRFGAGFAQDISDFPVSFRGRSKGGEKET